MSYNPLFGRTSNLDAGHSVPGSPNFFSAQEIIRRFQATDQASDQWNFIVSTPGSLPHLHPSGASLQGSSFQGTSSPDYHHEPGRLWVPPDQEPFFWSSYKQLIDSGYSVRQRLQESPTVVFGIYLPPELLGPTPGSPQHSLNSPRIPSPLPYLEQIGQAAIDVLRRRIVGEIRPYYFVSRAGDNYRLHFPLIRLSRLSQMNDLYPELTQSLERLGLPAKEIINYDTINYPLTLIGSADEHSREMWQILEGTSPILLQNLLNEGTVRFADQGLLTIPQLAYLSSATFGQSIQTTPNRIDLRVEQRNFRRALVLIDDPRDMAEGLLPLISHERFLRPREFKEIGQALYFAFKGEPRGLLLWREATERAYRNLGTPPGGIPLFESCQRLYRTFSSSNITVRTLGWYAKTDNSQGFHDWHTQWLRPAYDLCVSCLHTDVCYVLRRIFWLEHVCAGIGKNLWYSFDNNTWSAQDCGADFKKDLRETFLVGLDDICHYLRAQSQGNQEEQEKAIAKYENLIDRMKTRSYKISVYQDAMEHFYDGSFSRKLDTNPRILGLENGVIEADLHEAVFRPGKPDDHVTRVAPIYYDTTLTWDSPMVQKVMNWLNQLFINPALRDHFILLQCSIFLGRNVNKVIEIWEGKLGNNGKSTMVKMLEQLGPYFIKFPRDFLSRKSRGGGPSPEIAQMKGARIAVIQETEAGVPMFGGLLKELSGADSTWGRMLQENGGMIQNMLKPIIICNKAPPMTDCGQAMKNRIWIIPFDSTWSNNAPSDPAEQWRTRVFPIDNNFEDEIPEMAPAFYWILVQYFARYAKEGINPPEEVIRATNKYWKDNDPFAAFLEKNFEKVTDENGNLDQNVGVDLEDIYRDYKNWFKEAYPSFRMPADPAIKHELESRLGEIEGDVLVGYRRLVRNSQFPTIPGNGMYYGPGFGGDPGNQFTGGSGYQGNNQSWH